MAEQLGRDMLVKIDVAETFTTLCGTRSKSLTINNEVIDVTTPDCTTPGGVLWRKTLDGLKSVSVSFSGVFQDEAAEAAFNTVANSATPRTDFQIILPNFGTYEGEFVITAPSYSGEYTDAVMFDASLESSGPITFTAA